MGPIQRRMNPASHSPAPGSLLLAALRNIQIRSLPSRIYYGLRFLGIQRASPYGHPMLCCQHRGDQVSPPACFVMNHPCGVPVAARAVRANGVASPIGRHAPSQVGELEPSRPGLSDRASRLTLVCHTRSRTAYLHSDGVSRRGARGREGGRGQRDVILDTSTGDSQ